MSEIVRMMMVAIAVEMAAFAGGKENPMLAVDILAGRHLSDFFCHDASQDAVAETFSLSNGVLTANAAHALVLECPERYDYENFALFAEVRYGSGGFADSGLQFCIEDIPGKNGIRKRMEYQLKTVDIGDGWGLGGIRAARSAGASYLKPNAAGDVRIRRQSAPVWISGVWHKVSVIKEGNRFSFFFDGKIINTFVVDAATGGWIGFQTKPYPEGRGVVSFKNVKIMQL